MMEDDKDERNSLENLYDQALPNMDEVEVIMDGAGIGPPIDIEVENLVNILRHLSAEEIREARLVSRDFNEVICSHPYLLWAKNQIILDTQPIIGPSANDSRTELDSKWTEFTRLVARYGCPNIHLYKTNLVSPGASKFFRSPTYKQIRRLKMTGCEGKSEALLCVLGRVSKNLEYLEIIDFSYFNLRNCPKRWSAICFTALRSIIFQSQSSDEEDYPYFVHCVKLPYHLLYRTITGCSKLTTLILKRWSPETCQACLNILRELPLPQAGRIQCLEISCLIEEGHPLKVERYSFLKEFRSIQLPSLKILCIEFNRTLETAAVLSDHVVEDYTKGMATFLEACAENLEVLELLNCPISSDIFGEKSSFPKLFRVDTRGSIVTKLGFNTIDEASLRKRNKKVASKPRTSRDRLQNTEDGPQPSQSTSTQTLQSRITGRTETYAMVGIVFLATFLVHFGQKVMFPDHPYIGNTAEVFIFATIVFWVTRGSKIVKFWPSLSSSSAASSSHSQLPELYGFWRNE